MGQQVSKPGPPTTKMQVLGLGASRTGTASFTKALEILLDGPAYHSGGQMIDGGSNSHMWKWTEVLRVSYRHRRDPNSITKADRAYQKYLIAQLVQGFVAVTDTPCCLYAEILMELFPDAKVIVTTRDEEQWWQSHQRLVANISGRPWLQRILLFWLPGMRHWTEWLELLGGGRYAEVCAGKDGQLPNGPELYRNHMNYLARAVPEDKLFYYDVKSGWDPLCKILGVPVPEVDFPHINDAKSMEAIGRKVFLSAIMLWAGVLFAIGIAVAGLFYGRQYGITLITVLHGAIDRICHCR